MRKESPHQFLLRLPREFHEELKRVAQAEGLSLNQYCLYLLARHSASSETQKTKKAESLFQFLEEAHAIQNEFRKNKKITKTRPEPPLETPVSRYHQLYG